MDGVVWLASYPKSGNTWTRALLAAYFGEGVFDLNDLGESVHFGGLRSVDTLLGVDPALLHRDELLTYRPAVAHRLAADVAARGGRTFAKLHSANVPFGGPDLPYPPGAGRAVYVVRNPLDVAASMAPFFGWTHDRVVDVMGDDAFVLNDRRGGGLMQIVPEPMHAWATHVRSWLDAPGVPVHCVRFEDLKADAAAAFDALLRFVGETPDPERVAVAVEAARFENLRQREADEGFKEHARRATAPFFRKGKVGGWRDELSADQARRIVADHRETMLRLGYADAVAEVEALPA